MYYNLYKIKIKIIIKIEYEYNMNIFINMNYSVKENQFGTKYLVNVIQGSFEIYDYLGTPSMSIFIEDEYQGQGISRIMMKEMMRQLNWPGGYLLYIDTDASEGFWRHIGMTTNENGNGYELSISVDELNSYLNS